MFPDKIYFRIFTLFYLLTEIWTVQAAKNPDTFSILFVTDFHNNKTLRCDFSSGVKYDASTCLVLSAISAMQTHVPDPDVLILGGDSYPHEMNYTLEDVIEINNFILVLLRNAFPNTLILPVFGNHDYYPNNQFPPMQNPIYELYNEFLASILNNENTNFDQENTVLKGGYYSHIADMSEHSIEFIMLNTNLYYRHNLVNANATDPAEQFDFLELKLMDAQENNRKVVIVGHMAPGYYEQTYNSTPMFHEQYTDDFIDIITDYSDVISLMVFGHHHTDSFHLLEITDKITQVLFLNPSITPWHGSFSNSNNPGFRKYDITFTGVIDAITTYWGDLQCLQEQASLSCWQPSYEMKSFYGLRSIDGKNLEKLVDKFNDNCSLLIDYVTNNVVRYTDDLVVNERFLIAQICGIKYMNKDDYEECLETVEINPLCVKEWENRKIQSPSPVPQPKRRPERPIVKSLGTTTHFSLNLILGLSLICWINI